MLDQLTFPMIVMKDLGATFFNHTSNFHAHFSENVFCVNWIVGTANYAIACGFRHFSLPRKIIPGKSEQNLLLYLALPSGKFIGGSCTKSVVSSKI